MERIYNSPFSLTLLSSVNLSKIQDGGYSRIIPARLYGPRQMKKKNRYTMCTQLFSLDRAAESKLVMLSMSSPWRKLYVNTPKVRIRLDLTLQGGQSFRWRETGPGEWTNVLCGYVWTLKQSENDIFYRVYESVIGKSKRILKETCISPGNKTSCHLTEKKSDIYESILRDYFQLDVDTHSLFEQWRSRDPYFVKVSENMPGVRVLRQDPVETLFAFICSSNNNIPRISGMVEKLCQEYGEKLGDIGGVTYYAFPEMKDLKGSVVEEHLRSVGFGYRAKFISQCASYILQHHDSKWLEGLRSVSYDEAHAGKKLF